MAAQMNPRAYNAIITEKQIPNVLYLIILKDHVFACKANSRSMAIDIARDSYDFGCLIDNEILENGRPVNPYTLDKMKVIRVKPWHRIDWELTTSKDDEKGDDYVYVCIPYDNEKPLVYYGNSNLLDFVSERGIVHKVFVHNQDKTHIQSMIGVKRREDLNSLCDPYEIV
jgi:hypothetical protein